MGALGQVGRPRNSREDNTAASATVDFTTSIVLRITVHRNDLVLSREHFTNLACSNTNLDGILRAIWVCLDKHL